MEQEGGTEMIHFVNGKEPVGMTFCGGNIFTGEIPGRDRITLVLKNVTCPACIERLVVGAAASSPEHQVGAEGQKAPGQKSSRED